MVVTAAVLNSGTVVSEEQLLNIALMLVTVAGAFMLTFCSSWQLRNKLAKVVTAPSSTIFTLSR